MNFTSVIRLFPTDERGIEIATSQILRDFEAGLIHPEEIDKLFASLMDVYSRVKEAKTLKP